jgi:hypothetical protein
MIKKQNSNTDKLLTVKNAGEMQRFSKHKFFRLNACIKIPDILHILGGALWAKITITKQIQAEEPERKFFETNREENK